MRKLVYAALSFLCVCVASCHSEPDASAIAAGVAKQYYDSLIAGRYDWFVDGIYRPETIPAGYRSQLVDNAKMFMAQMRDEHRGIDSVRINRAAVDSTGCSASVFLTLLFADSTAEVVIVPMHKHKNVWLMR